MLNGFTYIGVRHGDLETPETSIDSYVVLPTRELTQKVDTDGTSYKDMVRQAYSHRKKSDSFLRLDEKESGLIVATHDCGSFEQEGRK